MENDVTSCMGSIVQSPKSVVAQEFSTVIFQCQLKPETEIGVRYLTVSWLWNGMEVNNSAGRKNDMAYVIMPHVIASNVGNYTCKATNKYGSTVSEPATLTIIPRKSPDAQDQFLVVSDHDLIRGVDLVSTPASTVNLFTIPGTANISSLAFDTMSQKLLWSQVMNGTRTYVQSNFNGTVEAMTPKLNGAQCVAVDWIGRHIYFVELVPGRISLISMDASYKLVVIPKDIVEVDTLVVDPVSGLMFWLVKGASPKIEKATMSGEDRSTFLPSTFKRTWQPVALAFDQAAKRLCIADSLNNVLWYGNVDATKGQSFHVAVQDGLHLAISNGTAYMSEATTKSVWQWKLGNTTAKTKLFELSGEPSALTFYSRSGQSDQNACSRQNGGCSQICLPKPLGRVCACPETNTTSCMPSVLRGPFDKMVYKGSTVTFHCQVQNTSSLGYSVTTVVWTHNGTELLSYNASSLPSNGDAILTLPSVDVTDVGFYYCNVSNKYGSVQSDFGFLAITPNEGYLLIAEASQIAMMDPFKFSSPVPVVRGLHRVINVDCALSNGSIIAFWVDSVQQVIAKKQLLVDVQATEVIAANVTKPYGIAVDWMGSMIFFTEQSQDFIGVVSMNGDYILPVVYLGVQDDPGPIAVDPERGWMFWANMGLGGPRIERAYMSGESRKVLVNSSSGVRRPAAIAFDPDNRQLFWIDASFDKIAKIDVQTGVQQVIDNFYHDVTPFGLALNQTSIYWTEQRESKIRVSPRKGYSFSVPPLTTSRTPFGLAFCRPKQWAGNNSCSSSNCDQLCLPNADRGRCACSYGILQKDSVTCRIPNNYILVAENRRIRGFVLNDSNTELKNAIRPINVNRPLMMDYNPLNGNLYYSDLRERAVMEVNLLGGQTRTIRAGLRYPEGVAVDPSAGVVYYCDREMNIIGAVTIEQGWNAVIIKSGLDEPRALALDIADRRIYWTDWGTTAHIGRAFMSGEERETIIQTGLGWPNAIVLDVENKKMYWSDAKFDKIEVANMNGTGRRILAQFSNKIHPFGLAIWNNSIYWTDWQKTGIARIQLSDSTSQSDLSTESLSYKYPVLDDRGGGLALVSASQKIVPSKCADNGGCIGGSVCLPDVTERRCVCHYGVYNDTNNQCEVPPTFIVISDGDQVRGIHSTSTSHAVLDVFEPLESPNPVGVDYDAVTKRIYWTDVTNNSIYSSSFQGEKEVLIGNLSQPEGVAVDWIGRKVYYTDRSLNRIGVVTMDGQQHVVILENLSRPRAIVVDPEKGYMFWSSDSKIERADMAGEWRKKLIMTPSSTSVQPIGLALDRQTQKVYWADAHQDKIVESDVHRMHGHVAFRAPGHDLYPFGLAYFNGTVYFSDQNLRGIFRWTVGSRSAKRMLITALKPAGVAFYDGGRTSGSNACSYNNGGCAQLCLPIPSGRRCACTRENTTSCQPLILTSPYSVTVEEKDTVTLSCAFMASNTTGLSYTSAQWLKNDTVVKSYNASDLRYTDFVTLEMEYVDSNHSGVYTCQATNKYGEVFSSPAKVTVKPRTSKSVQVLVAADGDRIRSIKLVSTPTVVVERFPSLLGNGTVIAVDYDITSDTVAWVESGSNSTNRFVQAFLNGTRKSAFTQYGQVKGFGYDWNTDSVFYTQPDLHRICVNTWTGSHPVVLVRNSTERPLDLVIVPELGFMWWIANSTDGQHIKKSTISGGNILRFRDDLVTSPSKLAFDRSTKKLIWIDGNKVFQCDFDGEQCSSDVMLPISRMDVKGIAATNGTLYISDQANGTIWSWRLNSTFPLTRLLDSTEIGALATYKNKLAMGRWPLKK
jgi:sugar lactone lactonase YvrE